MIIDSHCHLNHFSPTEIDDIVNRALESDVGILHTICTTIKEFPELLALTQRYQQVYTSVGIHPSEAADRESIGFNDLLSLTKQQKVISLGETGLDLYKNSNLEKQKKNFEIHIQVAQKTGLPLVIHTRDADEYMADILASEMRNYQFKGVMHCFSSSEKLAFQALDLGLYISFSGILTFKNAQRIRDLAANIPKNRTLIETDSPFLCPEPHRGKINQPSMVKHVAECLAKVWKVDIKEIHNITTKNCINLFDQIKFDDQKFV